MDKVVEQLFKHDAATWALALILITAVIALIRNVMILIFRISDRFKPQGRPCDYLVKLQEQVANTNVTVAEQLSELRTKVEFIYKELNNGMGFARRAQYERKAKNENSDDR